MRLARPGEPPGVVLPRTDQLVQTARVSFDVFLQRFDAGDAGRAEADTVLELLEPFMDRRQPQHSFARLVTSDGTADVYGADDLGSGLMVTMPPVRRSGTCCSSSLQRQGSPSYPSAVAHASLRRHRPRTFLTEFPSRSR